MPRRCGEDELLRYTIVSAGRGIKNGIPPAEKTDGRDTIEIVLGCYQHLCTRRGELPTRDSTCQQA